MIANPDVYTMLSGSDSTTVSTETSVVERYLAVRRQTHFICEPLEREDYVMGEMQQKAAENGTLKEIIFGRNEPALHHFHTSYREALGQPPLEKVS